MKKLAFFSTLLVAVVAMPVFVFSYVSPGAPTGYVNDFAGIISEEVQNSLESELSTFAASTTIEIVVATVQSLEGDNIASFANSLFREWGIGKKEENNGVMLLVAPNERQVRIEVGYGLEGALTDLQSGYIIDSILTPEFKEGNYDQGITKGVMAIEQVVKGEQFEVTDGFGVDDIPYWVFEFGLFLILIMLQIGTSILAKSKECWHGGVLGGLIGLGVLTFFGVLIGVVSIIGLVIFGLIFDYYVSSTYKKWKRGGGSRPWYMGGSGGSSGGGFGGFGGGSSGGGGASGSW